MPVSDMISGGTIVRELMESITKRLFVVGVYTSLVILAFQMLLKDKGSESMADLI